ncbi:MAG: ShlB/FhaC/HecB family hemolysin secretion/activation protein [Sedimentisphaerales bacterium]|nr:ShlB/FhaC/HecB family hemolysin secretion/activation protein [Sedimentisphaerales bacterium]
MDNVVAIACFIFLALTSGVTLGVPRPSERADDQNESRLGTEDQPAARERLKVMKESGEESKRPSAKKSKIDEKAFNIDQIDLPEDTTPPLTVNKIDITGNSLISTDDLLEGVPLVYNASDKPLMQAESKHLYDLRIVREVILNPGQPHEVSSRSVQGFTQYLVSVYQSENYAGIFVRVKPDAFTGDGKLKDGILVVEVIEMPVSNVRTNFYSVEREKKEDSYLNRSVLQKWSPAKPGQVMNQKKLDYLINLLNLNPDRYVSATVTKGDEPESIALQYDIFEINPWHYFLQVDNSGTSDRQWNPRIGLINTNLTGRDDQLTIFTQVPAERGLEDNYSIYASYDFPLWTPRLRLALFGARSEYEVNGGGGIDFLGNGYVYGGELRYNVFQKNDWFFDLTTSLSREKSKVTTSLFPQFFGSKVSMDLWGVGIDVHRRSDMANTSIGVERIQSIGGSSQKRFWDMTTSTGARTNAERDFKIITLSANHSQFLNPDKVQRLVGSFKCIRPDERLVPARMTTFGGMYSVRGYKESRIVADGGILGSIQYEYDLIRKSAAERASSEEKGEAAKGKLKKVAPLVFFDYGRAKTKDHVAGEKGTEELCSVGLGVILEQGEHLNAGIYYGYPLRSAGDTDAGDGRLNVGFMARF